MINHALKIKDPNTGEEKTQVFTVVVLPDEDRWSAWCPALEKYAATTWGDTKEEALQNIQEVIEMIVQELIEGKEAIPEDLLTVALDGHHGTYSNE